MEKLNELLREYAQSIRRDDGTAFIHADAIRELFRAPRTEVVGAVPERIYQYAQPGSPEFDGAEAYEQHLAQIFRKSSAASENEPEPSAEVTDEQIAAMFERVTGYSIENGRAALNDADILGFARELLEAARAGEGQ